MLIDNLIDNAVRYSPPGGHVSVWVGHDDAHPSAPVLQVDDDGPGIPEADREMVFDRFVRRDNAADQTGSGLGLAIVRQVALRQDAEVALSESPRGGLRVRVVWAARDAPYCSPNFELMMSSSTARTFGGMRCEGDRIRVSSKARRPN